MQCGLCAAQCTAALLGDHSRLRPRYMVCTGVQHSRLFRRAGNPALSHGSTACAQPLFGGVLHGGRYTGAVTAYRQHLWSHVSFAGAVLVCTASEPVRFNGGKMVQHLFAYPFVRDAGAAGRNRAVYHCGFDSCRGLLLLRGVFDAGLWPREEKELKNFHVLRLSKNCRLTQNELGSKKKKAWESVAGHAISKFVVSL